MAVNLSYKAVGFVLMIAASLSACTGLPEKVEPVQNFEADRYLGSWYEIARLDHSFERGMSQVTAEYSLREDGGIKVINRGYSDKTGKWKQAEGKAYFVNDRDQGHLKVSFFGPFYGSYAVFELDQENYQYAFVAGNSTEYLWLLSRTAKIDEEIKQKFISKSRELGFPTENLIFVEQE